MLRYTEAESCEMLKQREEGRIQGKNREEGNKTKGGEYSERR